MPTEQFIVAPDFVELLSRAGIRSVADVFNQPIVRVWRSIRERENATIDLLGMSGSSPRRLHVKRDKLPLFDRGALAEALGIERLRAAGIKTATMAAHGMDSAGRGFVITADLVGYTPADKLLAAGESFERLLRPLADAAGRLHAARLFHGDLYLCHFLVRRDGEAIDVRLIDLARVVHRPIFAARRRVKDLAQFHYSAAAVGVNEESLERWLSAYEQCSAQRLSPLSRRRIRAKIRTIARHDARLKQRSPERDVSLPPT